MSSNRRRSSGGGSANGRADAAKEQRHADSETADDIMSSVRRRSNGAGGGSANGRADAAKSAGTGDKPIKYCPRPSRGYSAMTDDRGAAVASCGPPCCVPNGCVKPEGHYACDRQAAKVLAQYVTPDERHKVLRWLDALGRLQGATTATRARGRYDGADADYDADHDEDEQSERSMYTTCLLMLLRSGRLVAPFTRPPPEPPRPLKPLRDAVDRRLYKRVQIECRRRRLHERTRYARPADGDRTAPPSGFFDRMPEPYDGVLCYGAVFSDLP